MIAVDWGTSNFRAYRLSDAGDLLERRSAAAGILNVEHGRFAEALQEHVGDWIAAGESRILLSGMVGSRQGWVEAGYLACPVTLEDLARAVVRLPFECAEAVLIPGVMSADSEGIPEVMRGEETEVMGMMEDCQGAGLICLPGTHSKWIQLKDRAIAGFLTSMTGEVFGALRSHTILGRTMVANAEEAKVDASAFQRGVARSKDANGLLHHLFGVRSQFLMDQLKGEDSADYLSGLLIGHEVRSILPVGGRVFLGGATHLSARYALAIEACGGTSSIVERDAGVRGLAAIARRLLWI